MVAYSDRTRSGIVSGDKDDQLETVYCHAVALNMPLLGNFPVRVRLFSGEYLSGFFLGIERNPLELFVWTMVE